MRIEWQIGFWIAAFALLIIFLWMFNGVLLPFAAAFCIGYLLDPVADRLERMGLNRLGATLIILAVFILALVLIVILLVPVLGHQLAGLIQSFPGYVKKLQDLIAQQSDFFTQGFGGEILAKLGLSGVTAGNEVRAQASDLVSQGATWAAAFLNSLWTRTAALVSLLSLLFVTPVVAFYMLLDWDKMIATIDGLVPLRHRDVVRSLAREIDAAMAGFLRGQSLVCLFLGLWYGLGLSIIGLNFGLLIGITGGVLSFIPYVGSLTVLVVSAIVAIVQGWPNWHLLAFAGGVFLIGQFLEGNILSPKLVGGSVGLHPVWLMFALLAFGSLFGFTGLIVAVPMAAATGVILRFAVRRYRTSPLYTNLPVTTPSLLIDMPSVQRSVEER
jgi:predicted PurR-regulated permease PerM